MTAGSALDSLLHGKAAPAGRLALGAIPLVGGKISKALLPPKTGPNAPKTATSSGVAPNNTTTTLSARGKTTQMTQRELKGNNPDELTRWQGLTSKAKANVQLNNPTKFIRDTQLQAQNDANKGNTIQAFKDKQSVATTQINTAYPKAVVQAYGLNSTEFKAYLLQNPNSIGQLQQYDKQLVDNGLSSTKFTSTLNKALGLASLTGSSSSKSSSRSSKTASTKQPKIPNFKISSSKLKAPKVGKISIKGGSGGKSAPKFKSPKLASAKSSAPKAPKLNKKTPSVAQAKVGKPPKVA